MRTMEDKLEASIERMEDDVEAAEKELICRLKALARDLARAAKSLEAGHSINSLGVVQLQGADIDRRCGELNMRRQVLGTLGYIGRNA